MSESGQYFGKLDLFGWTALHTQMLSYALFEWYECVGQWMVSMIFNFNPILVLIRVDLKL